MNRGAPAFSLVVNRLERTDLVTMAQCVAIDAGSFPYPSVRFEQGPDASFVWVAREAADGPAPGPVPAAPAGRALGFLASRVRREHDLYIEGLATHPRARRRGAGRALLRAAIAFAGQRDLAALTLNVWTGNRAAVALYQGEGFEIVRELPRFYRPGIFESDDAYQMVRVLD